MVDGGATLNAGGFTGIGRVTMSGTGTATFTVNGTGGTVASTADIVEVTGSAAGLLNVARIVDTVTVTNLNVNSAGTFTKGGPGTMNVTGAGTGSGLVSVAGGVLSASGSGNLGTGNVSVLSSAVSLSIQTGVTNAIDDNATLSLAGGGAAMTADAGFANLASGVNETVAGLFLGGTMQANGTYGSTLSMADFRDNEFFSGTGIITVIPEPGVLVSLLGGLGSLAGLQRFRRRKA